MSQVAASVRDPSLPARTASSGVLPLAVGTTVCLLPFLMPAAPGNISAPDVAMAGSIAACLIWATEVRLPIALPYGVGVLLLMIGGTVAANLAAAPGMTGLVIVQDLLLLLWAAVLATSRFDPAIIGAATHAWCRMAPVYSGLVVTAYFIGFSPLSGVTDQDGVRAAYTFGDPNLAASYLVLSLFVMAACRRPRSTGLRMTAYFIVLVAIALTGSNGAMVTMAIGAISAFVVSRYRAYGLRAATLTLVLSATAAVLMFTLVLPRVDANAIRQAAASSVPLLRDSVGRSDGSSSEREQIVAEGIDLYMSGDATGYGPAQTKATLLATQAPYVKEAHNDYLATLLERGLIGCVGLLLLGAAIAVRCGRLVIGDLPPRFAELVPRPWLLAAALPGLAASAAFYEILHFRHLWTWLGLVAALVLAMQDREGSTR